MRGGFLLDGFDSQENDFKLLAPIVYWSNGLTAGCPSMKMLGKWRGITRIQYEQSGNCSYLSDFGIRLSPVIRKD